MIELSDDRLHFHFPQVHSRARLTVDFQRTLRIPDDGRDYPLPPGLDPFPLFHVDDYAERLPESWSTHGGVFLPIHQAEALWIRFSGKYPFAVQVATGKINAVSGEAWTETLSSEPQNYVVVPNQPWLDGYNVGHDRIRQFVAAPLGEGDTVEEQLTGEALHGGLQIRAVPMKAERYEELFSPSRQGIHFARSESPSDSEMGLAPGGLMRQRIHEDLYGEDAWEADSSARCFVHMLNSPAFREVTGNTPPQQPPTAEEYTAAGLPWFELYDADQPALEGVEPLRRAESLGTRRIREGRPVSQGNPEFRQGQIRGIQPTRQRSRE